MIFINSQKASVNDNIHNISDDGCLKKLLKTLSNSSFYDPEKENFILVAIEVDTLLMYYVLKS